MHTFFTKISLLVSICSFGQTETSIVTKDITNFWAAYEKITLTADSLRQYELLRKLYIDQGTHGLKNLIELRRYTDKEYIDAINQYPRFWTSLRKSTDNIDKFYPEIEADIQKLKNLYKELKPATIYFSIGCFRTNGTIKNNQVLIGSEMSLADDSTIIDELPKRLQDFYRNYQPSKNLALLCTHEYVHTQQNVLVENLLSMCLYEGIAEFVSCKATGKTSNSTALQFGKANKSEVVNHFVTDLFNMPNISNWLWGENRNVFKVRDLGYFIGYEICERYYDLAKDKRKAVKELIELDYKNEAEVERIVDASKLFPKKLKKLYKDYEKSRPRVISVKPLKTKRKINSGICQIELSFSSPMDTLFRGFDYGPLGEKHIYKFLRIVAWSPDKKSLTYEVELLPNKRYQFLITNSFRNEEGIRLKPYLVEFYTK